MIKQLHFKWMLLLCALMVGTNVAWADDSYTQVTSLGDIDTEATYIIGDISGSPATARAFGAINASNKGSIITSGLSVSGTTIIVSSSADSKPIEFSLTKTGDYYFISYGATTTYLKYNSGTNFTTSTTEPTSENNGKWSIAYNDTYSCLLISNVGSTSRMILRNGTSGYGPYSNSNLGTYGKATLFKKVTAKSAPTISFANGSVNVGKTLDLSTLFSSNSNGAVTYSITDGESYASIAGDVLTGKAVGSVTVKASQAAAGDYRTGEATATITVNAALTLSSIAVTTAPTKTTYTEGETFDATGMVVTATYSNSSTDDVTASCTFTPSGELTTSDTKITISYTENAVEKTTTQAITVNEYVQPTGFTLSLNNAFFGTSYTGTDAKGSGPHSNTSSGVTVTYTSGGDKNNFYINDSEIRVYDGNTLQFDAPSGYVFTKLVFASAWNATIEVTGGGSLDSDRKIWTNENGSSSVSFAPGGRSDVTTVVVTLAPVVGITAVGLATYTSDYDLDYTSVAGIEAYIATMDGSTIRLAQKNKVPANTGVLLRATAGGTSFVVPVATGAMDNVTGNLFVRGAGTAVASSEPGYYNYILNKVGDVLGFYRAAGNTVAKNRAYLHTKLDANAVALDFDNMDDMTTAIDTIEHSTLNIEHSEVYNLNGQRVSQPTKGLYIVNGKKVVVK